MIRCVGGVVHDEHGRLLLILRGHAPSAGLWSLPGGRVEAGESDAEAVIREMAEETALQVECGTLAGTVVNGPYEIHDYRCVVLAGTPTAGDDAADIAWVDADRFAELDADGALVTMLSATLADWGMRPTA